MSRLMPRLVTSHPRLLTLIPSFLRFDSAIKKPIKIKKSFIQNNSKV